jgi:3-isopropylmalate dehydrogenase
MILVRQLTGGLYSAYSQRESMTRSWFKSRSFGAGLSLTLLAEIRMWRLDHILVDNCTMQLDLHPRRFDVVLTEKLFGDILSNEGAMLAGLLGMLRTASIGNRRCSRAWTGLYAPVHSLASDIAGQNTANPLDAIASVAAMLEYSFGLIDEIASFNRAVEEVTNTGKVRDDLEPTGQLRQARSEMPPPLRQVS